MSEVTFQRCPEAVGALSEEILGAYPDHKPLVEAQVKFDFVFAFAAVDDHGARIGCALKHHGVPALGIAKVIKAKDRALGRADVEITLDGDWWNEHGDDQRRALLDHELHHCELKTDKFGSVLRDDLQRPKLRCRHHDFEFGWFTLVAERHGAASQEQIQARAIMDQAGQFYWPDLFGKKPSARKTRAKDHNPPTIHIQMDQRCSSCGKGGATQSGLCLACAAKAIRQMSARR